MRLHEYQAKAQFARYEIPILTGELVQTPEEAIAAFKNLSQPAVLNAQVLANERVFRAVKTLDEVSDTARKLFDMRIDGFTVNQLLVEPQLDIQAEFGLSIEFDRSRSQMVIVASSLHRKQPIIDMIDPLLGLHIYQARYLASGIDLPREHWDYFVDIALKLYRCYIESDATRVVILPLALTTSGNLIALGGKIELDDNALYRQPELAAMRDLLAENELPSKEVYERVRVMRLGGDVACIANGAGLAMATADALSQFDPTFAPGVIIEIDGEVTQGRLQAAMRHIPPNTRGMIINLFCARFSAVSAADNLYRVLTFASPPCPVVIRLAGKDIEQAQQRLLAAPTIISTVTTLTQAIELLSHTLSGRAQWQS